MKQSHIVFCEEYVKTNNKVEAYQKANPNCIKSTATTNSTNLLKKPDIQAYIDELRQESKNKAIWSLEAILTDLKTIAEDTKNNKTTRLNAYSLGAKILTPMKSSVNVTHSGQVDSNINVTNLSIEELKALAEEEV